MKERVAIYIDGGNTYRRLKNLGIPKKETRFDHFAFVKLLLGDFLFYSSPINSSKRI